MSYCRDWKALAQARQTRNRLLETSETKFDTMVCNAECHILSYFVICKLFNVAKRKYLILQNLSDALRNKDKFVTLKRYLNASRVSE